VTTAPAPRMEVRALNVLLAEDNAVQPKAGYQAAPKMGHQVTLAANGEEAVRAHSAVGSM